MHKLSFKLQLHIKLYIFSTDIYTFTAVLVRGNYDEHFLSRHQNVPGAFALWLHLGEQVELVSFRSDYDTQKRSFVAHTSQHT